MMRLMLVALLCLMPNFAIAAKYDCENDEVIEAVKTRLICQTIFTPCGHFGLPNDYGQIQSLDDKAMNDSFNRAYAEVALREAAAPYKKGVAELIALARVAVLNIRGLVSSANALAMDYNPNIDRYVCELNFTYEPAKLKSVAIFGIAKAVLKQPEIMGMLQKPNGYEDYRSLIARMVLESNIDKKVREYGVRKALFSVQPSSKTRFAIDVLKFEPPIYFFADTPFRP